MGQLIHILTMFAALGHELPVALYFLLTDAWVRDGAPADSEAEFIANSALIREYVTLVATKLIPETRSTTSVFAQPCTAWRSVIATAVKVRRAEGARPSIHDNKWLSNSRVIRRNAHDFTKLVCLSDLHVRPRCASYHPLRHSP
jgi:hypothetical protein